MRRARFIAEELDVELPAPGEKAPPFLGKTTAPRRRNDLLNRSQRSTKVPPAHTFQKFRRGTRWGGVKRRQRVRPNPKPPFAPAAKKALSEQRAIEGAKAMSEYTAEREAERAKTARLKELRLAKQAVDKKAPPSKKT